MSLLLHALRWVAASVLCLFLTAGICAEWLAPHHYSDQSRTNPNAAPSRQFLLGTDELGRDRFSRLLYGTRVSLLLAPAAAVISILIAVLAGGLSACGGPWWGRASNALTDLLLALPTILILLTARAMLPLNVSAWTSLAVTCILLGCFNWPAPAGIIRADLTALLNSDFLMQARAGGQSPGRIIRKHLVPNVRPILMAQFWLLVPVFILSEANLSFLGLGVSEPMPSWGNMLRELENYQAIGQRPWLLAPLGVLMLTILSLYSVLRNGEQS